MFLTGSSSVNWPNLFHKMIKRFWFFVFKINQDMKINIFIGPLGTDVRDDISQDWTNHEPFLAENMLSIS